MTTELESKGDVASVFDRCRAEHRAAFIPYLVAGDPSESSSVDIITAVASAGADLIELGIPYSDPLADGPTIQRASHRALASGMTFDRALKLAKQLTGRLNGAPVIGFTYYNPVLARGLERTARNFADCGLSGIIVPDLPLTEAMPLLEAFKPRRLAVTLLVAPTTPPGRAAAIASLCTDFVYIVSRMGVTGADECAGEQARTQIERLRKLTDKPLAVGFGIASALDVAAVASYADGVIVGSALIDRIAAAHNKEQAVEEAKRLCLDFSAHCRSTQAFKQST